MNAYTQFIDSSGQRAVTKASTPGDGAVTTQEEAPVRIDEQPGTVYLGYAEPGTPPTAPLWKIRKILTFGSETLLLYAGGDQSYTHVWSDRNSLTYL